MLAKARAAVGYKLLGAAFLLKRNIGKNLTRPGCERRSSSKRVKTSPCVAPGWFGQAGLGAAKDVLAWPGGWVLLGSALVQWARLFLGVSCPSGIVNGTVLISDESRLLVATVTQLYKEARSDHGAGSRGSGRPLLLLPEYLRIKLGMSGRCRPVTTLALQARVDRRNFPP